MLMSFDFYQQYNKLSNQDLLKIVRLPERYVPEAVAIATDILTQREISADELMSVESYLEKVAQSEDEEIRQEESDQLRIKEFIVSMVFPGRIDRLQLFLNILVVLLMVHLGWLIYINIELKTIYRECVDCLSNEIDWQPVCKWTYYAVVIYLLFFRRKYGWILLMAGCLYMLVDSVLSEFFVWVLNARYYYHPAILNIYTCVATIACISFISRKQVTEMFKISSQLKRKTMIIAGAVGVIYVLIRFFGMDILDFIFSLPIWNV